jgi:type IV secretory pathway VirB3-like protein
MHSINVNNFKFTDLSVILKAYARLGKFNEENFVQLGIKYNQQNKTRKIRKRKIKRVLKL